jgi:hypothetical protein
VPDRGTITVALRQWRAGDEDALARLAEAVYSQLRRVAGSILAQRAGFQIIQPTELVHELYFHLVLLGHKVSQSLCTVS